MPIRKPRIKRKRFDFKEQHAELALDNPIRFMTTKLMVLGHFGYRLNPDSNKWDVTYILTGHLVHSAKTEKSARMLCKRFYTKVKTYWKPNKEELWDYFSFVLDARNVVESHTGRKKTPKELKFHKTPKPIDQYPENELPF